MNVDDWALRARIEIHDLYGRWSHGLDRGAYTLPLDDFLDDGVLWASDRGTYQGRKSLEAIFAQRAGATMHIINTIVVESVAERDARAHAYFQLADLQSGAIVALGVYDDGLRHVDGRWRWHRKAVTFLWRAPRYTESVADLRREGLGTPNPVGGLLVDAAPATP